MRPMYQYGVADIAYGQRIQLGTSSPIELRGSSSYSIGFWLRPRAPAYDGVLLMSGNAYYIGQHGMALTLSIPGMSEPRRSEIALLRDQWQYVLLSFQSQGTSQGSYTLYVNGTPLIEGSISHVTANDATFSLGPTSDAQFSNVAFWTEALPLGSPQPVWDVPAPGPTLAACYSFRDGSLQDVSGNNHAAASRTNGAQVVMTAPSMRLTNAAVLPSARDALSVVADGAPFTVQAWFNADAPSQYQAAKYTVFSCLDRGTQEGFSCGLWWNGTGFCLQAQVTAGSSSSSGQNSNIILPPGSWHHLAATFDGTQVALYCDGVLASELPYAPPVLRDAVWLFGARYQGGVAGQGAFDFQGHLQALGLWSRALSATEVQTYMTVDPTDVEGCVAFYAWNGLNLANQVTGNPPLLLNTAGPALAHTPPSDSTPPPSPAAGEARVAAPASSIQPAVRWSTEEVPYPSQSPIPREQAEAMIAAYEPVLASVPEALRGRLRSLFRNNLYLGLSRGAGPGGMPVGAIMGKVMDGQYVFFHYTAEGPVECGRMELDVDAECVGWVISLAATALCLLLTVVGLGYASTKAVSALRPLIQAGNPLFTSIKEAVAIGATDGSTVIRIIKALYISGSLGKVFGAMLTGSWFTIAANCASLILMVVGLFTSGGAYLAVVLAQLMLNIAILVAVILQKPESCG